MTNYLFNFWRWDWCQKHIIIISTWHIWSIFNTLVRNVGCQSWSNVYEIVIESIGDCCRITGGAFVLLKFSRVSANFILFYDMFDYHPCSSKIIFVVNNLWLIIIIFLLFKYLGNHISILFIPSYIISSGMTQWHLIEFVFSFYVRLFEACR